MLNGILLYRRREHLVSASGRLVGSRNNAYYVEIVFYEQIKALDREVGSAEKYYSEIFFFHALCD